MSHFLCIHQTQQAPPDVNVLIVLFFQVLHSRKRTTWETPVQDWWHLQCRRDYSQNASNRTAKDYCSKWKETSWGYFQFTLVPGMLGIVSDPGSVNSREFLQWMTFFLLRESNYQMSIRFYLYLTIMIRWSHRSPDVCQSQRMSVCLDSLKIFFEQTVDTWQKSHAGRYIIQYDTGNCFWKHIFGQPLLRMQPHSQQYTKT